MLRMHSSFSPLIRRIATPKINGIYTRCYASTGKSLYPPKNKPVVENKPVKEEEPKPDMIESKAIGGRFSYKQIAFNVVLFCGGLYLISDFIFNTQYKNTGAYKMSMKLLESNSELVEEIGIPIKPYYNVSGRRYGGHYLYLNWKVAGPGGDASVVCRISFVGKKGSVIGLTATLEDGRVISIVDEEDSPIETESAFEKE